MWAPLSGEIAQSLSHILSCALDHDIVANVSTDIAWAATVLEDSTYCSVDGRLFHEMYEMNLRIALLLKAKKCVILGQLPTIHKSCTTVTGSSPNYKRSE